MEEVVKNHTCRRHIRNDGKSTLKGFRFGFHERTLIVYSSFRLPIIGNRSTHVVKMGWDEILPLKFYSNIKNKILIFLQNIVLTICRPVKHHPILHFPKIAKVIGNGVIV